MSRIIFPLPIVILLVFSVPGAGGLIVSRTDLENLLNDQMILEDFEGISVPGGTYRVAPNPLNSMTAPTWNLEPGVTYSSSKSLRIYNSSTNVLDVSGSTSSTTVDLDIVFDQPQLAIGFDLVNVTGGGFNYSQTLQYWRNSTLVEEQSIVVPSASRLFKGWQDPLGITRVHVEAQKTNIVSSPVIVDDLAWGIEVAAVPEPSSFVCIALFFACGVIMHRIKRKRTN